MVYGQSFNQPQEPIENQYYNQQIQNNYQPQQDFNNKKSIKIIITSIIIIIILTVISVSIEADRQFEQKSKQLHTEIPSEYTLIDNNYILNNYEENKEENIVGALCLSEETLETLESNTIKLGELSKITIDNFDLTKYRRYIEENEKLFICGDINIQYKEDIHLFSDNDYYIYISVNIKEVYINTGNDINSNIEVNISENEERKREEQLEAKRLQYEEEQEAREKEINSYQYSIYEKDGIVYVTANDIVHLSKRDSTSDYFDRVESSVCITGKIKDYSTKSSILSETVLGELRDYTIYFTEDFIYLDNDNMESLSGICIEVPSGGVSSKSLENAAYGIAIAEENIYADSTYYIYNNAYYWMQEQANAGLLCEGGLARVYGEGSWNLWNVYTVSKCTKIELLDTNGNVKATWIPKE